MQEESIFHLKAPFSPTGDQPQAIDKLVEGIQRGDKGQTLLGVTGSGKTFTMANIIARCNRPTLILEPNKTLASQICTEMRSFFPDDAVEYFVSYYDYYQPEAYIPSTDTYIEKDSAINDEIDRLRHSATAALSERRNVIIVASVSCIYSLGDPIDYRSMVISLRPGMELSRDELCRRLVRLQYERNDINFTRNKFRVHGDIVDIYLAYMDDLAIRVEFFGDEVDRISEMRPLTGERQNVVRHAAIFPASHYIVGPEKMKAGLAKIAAELDERVKFFTQEGKLLEAFRSPLGILPRPSRRTGCKHQANHQRQQNTHLFLHKSHSFSPVNSPMPSGSDSLPVKNTAEKKQSFSAASLNAGTTQAAPNLMHCLASFIYLLSRYVPKSSPLNLKLHPI